MKEEEDGQAWSADPVPAEAGNDLFTMTEVALAVCVSCAVVTIVCGLVLFFGPGSAAAANTMGFASVVGLSAFLGYIWFLVNE